MKGAVDQAKSSTGLGGIVEGLKDKINGAAITDESPAKNLTDVRSALLTLSLAAGQKRLLCVAYTGWRECVKMHSVGAPLE